MSSETSPRPRIQISLLEDFRRVSAIIDVDIVPETHRRVKLMKNGSDKPLGFYIRDGTSVRVTPHGLEKVFCFNFHFFDHCPFLTPPILIKCVAQFFKIQGGL